PSPRPPRHMRNERTRQGPPERGVSLAFGYGRQLHKELLGVFRVCAEGLPSLPYLVAALRADLFVSSAAIGPHRLDPSRMQRTAWANERALEVSVSKALFVLVAGARSELWTRPLTFAFLITY